MKVRLNETMMVKMDKHTVEEQGTSGQEPCAEGLVTQKQGLQTSEEQASDDKVTMLSTIMQVKGQIHAR